jgi:hypothetical protein
MVVNISVWRIGAIETVEVSACGVEKHDIQVSSTNASSSSVYHATANHKQIFLRFQ